MIDFKVGDLVVFETLKPRHSALLKHHVGEIGRIISIYGGQRDSYRGIPRVKFGDRRGNADSFFIHPQCLLAADALDEILAAPCHYCGAFRGRCLDPDACERAYERAHADEAAHIADDEMAEAAFDEYRYQQGERR